MFGTPPQKLGGAWRSPDLGDAAPNGREDDLAVTCLPPGSVAAVASSDRLHSIWRMGVGCVESGRLESVQPGAIRGCDRVAARRAAIERSPPALIVHGASGVVAALSPPQQRIAGALPASRAPRRALQQIQSGLEPAPPSDLDDNFAPHRRRRRFEHDEFPPTRIHISRTSARRELVEPVHEPPKFLSTPNSPRPHAD